MIRHTDVELWQGLINTNKQLYQRTQRLERLLKAVANGTLPAKNIAEHLGGNDIQGHETTVSDIPRQVESTPPQEGHLHVLRFPSHTRPV